VAAVDGRYVTPNSGLQQAGRHDALRGAALAQPPDKRLKLAARVDCGMNLSSARRSLSAIR